MAFSDTFWKSVEIQRILFYYFFIIVKNKKVCYKYTFVKYSSTIRFSWAESFFQNQISFLLGIEIVNPLLKENLTGSLTFVYYDHNPEDIADRIRDSFANDVILMLNPEATMAILREVRKFFIYFNFKSDYMMLLTLNNIQHCIIAKCIALKYKYACKKPFYKGYQSNNVHEFLKPFGV